MEFFKQVDLDWMGKAKYFFGLSFLLLAAGMASILAHGGLFYGIDFKGGTVVDVRFAGPPPIDTLRAGLAQQGIGNSTIVPVSDITTSNGNEVLINLEEKGQGAEALDAGKTAILNALHATLGAGEAGKQDFNAAGADTIADVLTRKDPWDWVPRPAIAIPNWRANLRNFATATAAASSPISASFPLRARMPA